MSFCTKHDVTTDSSMAAEGIIYCGDFFLLDIPWQSSVLLKLIHFVIYMDNEPFIYSITGDKGPSNNSKHFITKIHII